MLSGLTACQLVSYLSEHCSMWQPAWCYCYLGERFGSKTASWNCHTRESTKTGRCNCLLKERGWPKSVWCERRGWTEEPELEGWTNRSSLLAALLGFLKNLLTACCSPHNNNNNNNDGDADDNDQPNLSTGCPSWLSQILLTAWYSTHNNNNNNNNNENAYCPLLALVHTNC